MLNCEDEVLALTKKLVRVKSIVNSLGEKEMAHCIYSAIAALPYFQQHPEQFCLQKTVADEQDRYNVLAYVRGTKAQSNNTVILMGHLDTVGIDDFGRIQGAACEPDLLIQALADEDLPALVQEQLASGQWVFGRGLLDMKAGVAAQLYLLCYFSQHPEELAGNIIFLAECDEEDGSHGVLSALKVLKDWQERHGFEYIAGINADFVAPRYPGDENRYVYKGTVGKLLPSFYITGAETHVGSCFEGFDPNFLAAELTRQIDYNPELCNEAYGEVTVPPVSLKQTDLKPSYTVQTALAAYVYYNFFVHTWSPKEVLIKLKQHAEMAFTRALQAYEERYREYCRLSGETHREVPWQARVYTYEEFEQLLASEHGESYLEYMREFKQQLLKDKELDTRMFAARVVEEAWKWMKDKSPAVILFYSSLYSPRIEVVGRNPREAALMQALDRAIDHVQPGYPHPIVTRNFFPYISDMSFMALSDDEHSLEAVCMNNPGWGTKHYVEYQDIRDINVPVVNIGPYGYDAHKKYERAELTYSLKIVPNLIYQVITNLL